MSAPARSRTPRIEATMRQQETVTDPAAGLHPRRWSAVRLRLGGFALSLFAHVAFRYRNVKRFSTQRLVPAIIALAGH